MGKIKWSPEQELAINEEGKNIIVSAGAGSGKTAVLSERVLRKLKNGVHINELLVLTFTNAAAAEMKERIRKKILKEDSLKDNIEELDIAEDVVEEEPAKEVVKAEHPEAAISAILFAMGDSVASLKARYEAMGCGGYNYVYSFALLLLPTLTSPRLSIITVRS